MSAPAQYAMGRSTQEYERLEQQSSLLASMTHRTFAEAGIQRGMHVLDLGAGVGDVAMILAQMVGSEGRVTALDLDDAALSRAQTRAAAAGIANVDFVHTDFSQYTTAAPVDAIVGRFVLLYQNDPAAALTPLVRQLRTGGIVAFMEPWFMQLQFPDSMMVMMRSSRCILETLLRSGAHLDLGGRLHRIYQTAGLPLPKMRLEYLVDPSPDSPLYQHAADTLASVLPKAIELGIAKQGDFDLAAVPGQIRNEMQAAGYAMLAAPVVSAWCHKA